MVNESDTLDLDPEPSNILTVWGYDVLEKNIDKYFHPSRVAGVKYRGTGKVWGEEKVLGL